MYAARALFSFPSNSNYLFKFKFFFISFLINFAFSFYLLFNFCFLLQNNNLKQLLNDPNVLRQLQTLQNFQKFKQQEENQKHRYQDDARQQQHMQNAYKVPTS